ncbi:hypothetical protein H5410_011365 [Solanum commersonii]|uniref:Lipoxygenase n=1 Tax=Solanum commersonii TaxID=4109 RepID=A0A9J6APG3_SOLCO|nr:hypothetical protein H5410_011365 [Solanum commersonii]
MLIVDTITGKDDGKKVKGTVILMKKNVLDFTDINASVVDGVIEFLGRNVSFQLISSSVHANDSEAKHSNPAFLENWLTPIIAGESAFRVTFDWDHDEFGVPGAFIIKNLHLNEFFLKSLTLDDVPNHGKIHFVCNSWIYPSFKYKSDRIFFANQAYLPSETPETLRKYRENELVTLRGDGTRKLEEWDRVYDYACYNDLGEPDKGKEYARSILGGSSEYPYPRRGRTGRKPTKTDPNCESRIPLLMSLDIYVPRDERFGHVKMSDFLTLSLKSIMQTLLPAFKALFDNTPNEFDSFADVLKLYEGGIQLPRGPLLKAITDSIPLEILKDILQTDGQGLLKYPTPRVIQEDKTAWRTDEEFGREMLAGINPVLISGLQEFPPKSKLDPNIYGHQNSTISKEHVEDKLDGLTIDEAIKTNKIFILNHHDIVMPYLRRINMSANTKAYASKTLLFLQDNGTLKPLAIELSLPHPDGDQFGTVSKVYTPADQGVEGSIWQLAKAYAAVNDTGIHQLISHWLNTHAVMEPFVIATNRQLSVLHPIHKLLHPHFRDTMNINALARQILINCGGFVEMFLFPANYSMEMSAVAYKDWVFPEQALPSDLIKSKIVDAITGKKVKGTVVLMKKNVLDFTDIKVSVVEFLGKKVSFQLISSSVHDDPENGSHEGKLSNPAYLENWLTHITPIIAGESTFSVTFEWDHEEFGVPGAFIINNFHLNEFFLKSLTLEHVPNHGKVHFICNSWIYPASKYKSDRIFFAQDKSAWRTDEEFGRETLAGTNPVLISRLQEFPPKSNLDRNIYGNQNSTITREQIEDKLDGLTVDEAIKTNRLFMLNHHDIVMPLLRRINTSTNTKAYASRTLLFLQDTEILKPVAIELSLPHPNGDQFGGVSKVYTPSDHEGSIWQLAKAYATNDSPEWTKDQEPLLAFERFGKKLSDIENQIIQMNGDHKKWKNRSGPVKVP